MKLKQILQENDSIKNNLSRLLTQTSDRLGAWDRILNNKNKNVDKDDLQYLIDHLESVIKDLRLYHKNWDK